MLTLRYIKRSSQLEHSYGGRRPGHIGHDSAAIEGPEVIQIFTQNYDITPDDQSQNDSQSVIVSLDIEVDPETGELSIVS